MFLSSESAVFWRADVFARKLEPIPECKAGLHPQPDANHHRATVHTLIYTYGQFSVTISPNLHVFADRSTQRKPTQSQGEHANPTPKSLPDRPEDETQDIHAVRQQQ